MDPVDLLELLDLEELPDLTLPEVMPDLAPLGSVEALPVEALPVFAASWFLRLLRFFSRYALLLAFAGAMVENTIFLGFLLPGGAVVALAGAGARAGGTPVVAVVLLAAAGMTCGAIVDYFLGRAGIHQLLAHRWTGRFGKQLARQLHSATPLLRRHGWWVMLVAHAFGHGRSALAIAAGASNFGLRRFIAIEVPAALLWSVLYAGGGYMLAREWHTFEFILRRIGWVGAVIVGTGVLAWVLWQRWQRKEGGLVAAGEPADVAPDTLPGAAAAITPSPAPIPATPVAAPRGGSPAYGRVRRQNGVAPAGSPVPLPAAAQPSPARTRPEA